ncbi:protein TsetseEP-like [Liolophura sinensis]|uniref:protein TsetseEP-like n=1 Tax=Liolophura sinensis TaxID=3198878 RepID=UPI003159753C
MPCGGSAGSALSTTCPSYGQCPNQRVRPDEEITFLHISIQVVEGHPDDEQNLTVAEEADTQALKKEDPHKKLTHEERKKNPQTTPEETPETTPEEVAEARPEEASDTTPEETPEKTPEVNQETTAEEAPETTSEEAPEMTPTITTGRDNNTL